MKHAFALFRFHYGTQLLHFSFLDKFYDKIKHNLINNYLLQFEVLWFITHELLRTLRNLDSGILALELTTFKN